MTDESRRTKFREHLSIISPSNNVPIEKSEFSPVTPPPVPDMPSSPHRLWQWSSRADLESGYTPGPRASGFRDRVTKFMFDIRTFGREADIIPIQQPQRPEATEWPPLHIEKRRCPCCDAGRKKKRILWLIVLLVLLFFLLIDTIFLNVKVLSMASASTSPTQIASTNRSTSSTPTSSSPTTLSANAQQCLSQFTLDAPTNPTSYPCSSCYSVLQSIPSNFSEANPQDGQQILNALQFCGLSAVFDAADAAGQSTLGNGSWVQNVQFCAWTGVTCNGAGQVSTLQLTFPGVPASIPDELAGLTGLTNLQIIGNGAVPGGSLPDSFTSLTALSTLELQSTGLTAFPDNLFQSLSKVTTLELVKNPQFGSSLPSSLTTLTLQSLVINDQVLSNPLSTLASSSSLQSSLKLIDLSSTSLTGSIPSSISSLNALLELHLDSNNLQGTIPPAFPPNLQLLTLSNNTALSGSPPSSLCGSSLLKTCTMMETSLSQPNGGCGVCQFSA